MDSFKNEFGSFSKQARTSYKVPKTDEERRAFFEYLKEKGTYENMRTVNSMTLNAWAKQEFEAAALDGDMDFRIPGLDEPTISEYISMRKV